MLSLSGIGIPILPAPCLWKGAPVRDPIFGVLSESMKIFEFLAGVAPVQSIAICTLPIWL